MRDVRLLRDIEPGSKVAALGALKELDVQEEDEGYVKLMRVSQRNSKTRKVVHFTHNPKRGVEIPLTTRMLVLEESPDIIQKRRMRWERIRSKVTSLASKAEKAVEGSGAATKSPNRKRTRGLFSSPDDIFGDMFK